MRIIAVLRLSFSHSSLSFRPRLKYYDTKQTFCIGIRNIIATTVRKWKWRRGIFLSPTIPPPPLPLLVIQVFLQKWNKPLNLILSSVSVSWKKKTLSFRMSLSVSVLRVNVSKNQTKIEISWPQSKKSIWLIFLSRERLRYYLQ